MGRIRSWLRDAADDILILGVAGFFVWGCAIWIGWYAIQAILSR